MLFEVFNSVGPVTSIRVCRDTVSRRSLGYAYVNYQAIQDAERALDTLNYTVIKGQPCRIMWCHRDPSLRKSGNGNIFVKNLDRNIDNKALYDTFSLFGNILSCKVAVDEAGNSKGYGFVHYENEESGRVAIEKVNGMLIGGKTVFVGPFVRRADRDSTLSETKYTNVYIKNIPAGLEEESKLLPLFERFGPITSFCIKKDNKGRPFAFCNYENHSSAKAAVDALNGKRFAPPPTEDKKRKGKKKTKKSTAGMLNGGKTPQHNMMGMGGGSMKPQQQAVLVSQSVMQQQGGGGAPGSFKFTPQVRNQRLDQQQPQQAAAAAMLAAHHSVQQHHAVAAAAAAALEQSQNPLLNPDAPLTAAALAAAQPSMQKQMLGEKLFPLIARYQPELAGKITGMMLEMDNAELLILLESEAQLKAKVEEALRVLQQAA
ncbi:UNVERIFIED_CONTAM: hypothetical protein H355_001715 [Colinus virginianus]|nr:hypothetical protein H355_001715 [Colinus virginianus]